MPLLAFDFGPPGSANSVYAPDQGASWNFGVAWLDPAGVPMAFPSGYAASMQIRPDHSSTSKPYESLSSGSDNTLQFDTLQTGTVSSLAIGSTALALASGAFDTTGADVGKAIYVPGAKFSTASGGTTDTTTIASVTDATHATLTAAAGATVSSGTISWGGRVRIVVPGNRTKGYNWGQGYYTLIVTDPSGNSTALMAGTVYVNPGATF